MSALLLIITVLRRKCKPFPDGIGLILLNLNTFQTLLTAAEAYFHLGYAVIPLLGDIDPTRPKVAARAWSVYQQRLATLDEIGSWFSPTGGAAALGIVTGRISRLVVLDFDSPDLLADFRRRFPDLLETRTVTSAGRGLPHLYFHLPPHLRLSSQKRQGVDLLSDGRYVVAPPSTINDQAYRLTRGGMPRLLTEYDIQRLQAFVGKTQEMAGGSNPAPTERKIKGEGKANGALTPIQINSVEKNLRSSPTPQPLSLPLEIPTQGTASKTTRDHLYGLYQYWRSKTARNEALFRTALYARDHGWDESRTRRALAALHINQTSVNPIKETQAIRQREAYATIRSVFSRPARLITPSPTLHQQRSQAHSADSRIQGRETLPNSVREALMQRKLTYVIRTFEGLLLAGFRAGMGFTADQAIHALKGVVGRDSIYNALNAIAPNGLPFFPQRIPSAHPKASSEAANQKSRLKTKKCFFVTEKKSGIKKRGIQSRRFKMPTINDLCRMLGVKSSGSDVLTRDDLMSAHQTRMALHRELIKRRPGEYSRRWLANRLGVTRRTLDTYNRLIPIRTRATYHETALSWTSIDPLLTDEILAGAFIETLTGKKYPALRAVAARLLAKGTYIRLKQRASNLYWFGSDEPPPNILPNYNAMQIEPPSHREASHRRQERCYESRPYPKLREEIKSQYLSKSVEKMQAASVVVPPQETHFASASMKKMSLSPAQQEALAQSIYSQIDGLSLKNARKLASTYTEKHIRFALQRLQQHTSLANPSGFFVSVLRSTARMEGGN